MTEKISHLVRERMSSHGALDKSLNRFGLMLPHKSTRVFSHAAVVINLVLNLATYFENISFLYRESS